MTARQQTETPMDTSAIGVQPRAGAVPWMTDGVLGGLLGSAAVAILFLVRDIAAGWPLWTPSTLGAALFRGEIAGELASPEVLLVVGYSVFHGAMFVGIGLIAAYLMDRNRALKEHWFGTLVWAVIGLFIMFQILFLGFAVVFAQGLVTELGMGWVTLANLVAAVCMAGFLTHRARRYLRSSG
ncbi:MAG: hypothetical protein HKP27_06075 [Myxococcales bacterium]|nr:hypothetical protein [Myxococcales bacterium]